SSFLWGRLIRDSLVQDYVRIAKSLRLPLRDRNDSEKTAEDFIRWIEQYRDWLLVLDYVDDLEMARRFLPRNNVGHVLLTTRQIPPGEVARPQMLEIFSPEDGTLFLLRRLRHINLKSRLNSASVELRAQAEELSRLLGGFPLALNQAAAYIERN